MAFLTTLKNNAGSQNYLIRNNGLLNNHLQRFLAITSILFCATLSRKSLFSLLESYPEHTPVYIRFFQTLNG